MSSEQTMEPPRVELSATKRALIEARLRGKIRVSGIVRHADRENAPLSFAQERLWFLDRLQPGGTAYNMSWSRRLRGALDAGALERALGEIVRRHEALRTVFREVNGSPVQVVVPFAGFTLPVEDLGWLDGPEREAEMRRLAAGEAARPYDLSAGPLFRAALLRLAEDDHVLLVSMHHIVSDGWSMGVLSREFSALYEAYREGRESPLPELAVQYADYATWQRDQLQGEALERQLSYWRERLGDAPALLELPTDHLRPAVQSFRGAAERIELPVALLERLRGLGQSENATLYMVVLGAFQVLLSKYSGSQDIVVGSPVAGRTRKEVEGLIGFFVNTLVLRTDLSGDPSFRDVLRRVRDGVLGAYDHQELPFEKLVAELQPERSLGHSPLFQVSFTLVDVEEPAGGLAELSTEGVDSDFDYAKFDLSLAVAASPRGLRVGVSYATDLFERDTIVRALGHLERVLEQVAADADASLSRLALAGPEEHAQVITEWNQTERPYPRGVGLNDLFDAQVRERPDAVALAWGDEALTYAELDARANQLANHLCALGVGPEVRVGVLLERSAELVVAILAVIKAGGAYVPLDPGYPAERLRLMLSDSDARVLLARSELASAVPECDARVVFLDQLIDVLASESTEAPRSGASPENLAYICYTSGSTGKPKGVMVAHRHVVQLVCETDYVRFGPGDRIAQASNPSFDALTFEAWGAFLNGATLVGIPRDVLLSPPALHRMLREERITTLYQTTALLNQLSHEAPDVFAPLREVLFGGQAADVDSVRRILRAGGPQRLLHVYGPTETTAWCSWEKVEQVADDALTVSVGRATGNQRIYLLDPALNPVPVGVPGEAYVGGDGVVRGYLERPGLTAERFLPDPFTTEPGARMYRSGDRLRWKADGRLEFIGRVDEQVKIRGFRIEPGEVESVLGAHARVDEVRVIVREDQPGEKRLVAYVVGDAEAEALRAHLRESLPEYMVPSAFVVIDRLPLTPNGKLDVKALPAPELGAAEGQAAAPSNPVEEVLAGIWAEVLRLDRVGVHQNFFTLGGHSLLAIRVVSRIRDVFAVELPLRALFEGPTVAELAKSVEEQRRAGVPALPPVVPVERTDALPLSFAQERLWFLDRLHPGSTAYNLPWALRVGGALDEAALERALGEIVRRHEALRTVFREVEGAPVQVVAPFDGFALPVEDLSGLDETEREVAARRRVSEEGARSVDLAAGPLFHAVLLRLGAEDHVLLLSMHHIVSDGWSMGVLFRELSSLYDAYREGRESPLPDLGVQYPDYAAWQRGQLAGEALERQLAYWRERLADAPPLLELPTDHPRPAAQTFRGASERMELSVELLERLRELGRSEGATLYMVVLAAFQVLLSKYSGSRDVVVGSPIAGRSRKEVEELIGFFVNTLVLRTDLSGDPSFREVLGRVREATLGAYEHQELPFEKLVAELQPERSMGHSPLFQVSFTLEDGQGGAGGLTGLSVGGFDAGLEIAKFDLSLSLAATARGLRGGVTYSADLFERETIVRMLGHLERVLEQVAHDPARTLSRVDVLGEAERSTVLEEWNRTDRPYPRGVGLNDLFDAQVRERPDAVALAWGDEALTYAGLDARANQLANHLRALGVGPEVRVGVLLERSAELVVSVLAVIKAGGAYVPLDPGYPAERLRLMLADSDARVLLARTELASAVPECDARVVFLDQLIDALAAESIKTPKSGAAPENLAYICYTSGSTGKPKGVMVAHRHVVQLVCETDYVQFGPGDRIAQASNPSFDALTFEAWGAFLNGATLVGIPRDVLLSPPALYRMLREERITTLYQTTALLNQLSHEAPDVFAPLREVLFGGQAADVDSVRRVLKAGGPQRLLHVYGPTETTAWCSWEQVEQVADDALTVSVGRATGNQRIYLLDSALNPVPVGVPGEAYVGGDGVVRGYLERPGLTAERFLPDPFTTEPGMRMYRTGDRLRWKADGRLEFVGRVDEQVKIRGFRIEPGEIESVLSAHAEVRSARVIVREDQPGEKRLVAYVVGDVEAEALRGHLRESLPEYMVPSAFVVIDRLPLTPTGKLDVKALSAPEMSAADGQSAAPSNPVEEVLAGIWADVLGVERVEVNANFFALGGHSLLAIRVVSRIRAVFAVELSLRALFEGPTVAELARAVEEERRAGAPALPPVVPVERTDALPLSFAQERLWFLDRLQPGSTAYNMAWPLRLRGTPDIGALERALGEIVRRHEALRTVFREVNGAPVQVVAPFDGFTLPVDDLSWMGEAEREAEMRRLAADASARPFDLAGGPLFRAALLRLGEEDHVLLLSMHHIVSDGWSMGVLFRELSALYAAYREGGESPLAELAVQYADYAAWQREQLAGEALERQLAYWRERLADAPALLELPTDHLRPAVQTFRGASEQIELSAELLDRLRMLGRSEGATLYMVVLAAFQVLLSKYSGSQDIVVGSPVAGRSRKEVEELIGFFVNTLVLRTDLSGDPGFRAVLRRVREGTLGAYEHQELPFEKLVAELQPERSMGHSPLFQVSFSLEDGEGGASELAELTTEGISTDFGYAKFDLSLALVATRRGLRGAMSYSTDLFEPGTIARMLGHLERVLEQIAADADASLSRLALAGEEERAQVITEWNQTDRPYPRGVGLNDLFDAQVRERPDAVALAWGDEALTYAGLDARANQLANYLRAMGVGPEVRVGVLLERSAELVVAILAVIKAGGAYVPLDPGYPAERLRLMLADSDARVLLARSELASAVPECDARVVFLDQLIDVLAAESTETPNSGAAPENLAYICYTSGSTGKPKGVMVAHRHVVQLVCETDYVRFGPGDRIAQASNPSFDALTFEAWGAFLNGATLVGIPRDVLLSPPALHRMLREERITTLYQTTALLNQLSHEAPDVFAPLREVLFGGQAADVDSVRRLLKAGGPERLLHMYGPTETTAWCSWEKVEQVADDALTVSVGRATGNQRIYLLDSALNPVPVGVPGEAYVGGDGVVRGYLERPGLTAERFLPDPFTTEPGARMYRSGDRLRWKADGRLEFIGRVDEQVKIRGFRIEPGEIESVLCAHGAVHGARVIVREDQPGEKRLVAYVVGDVEAEALRAHLRESLPEYMVPSAFVVIDRLPLTPTGKLDVKALPAPEYAHADRYVAPRTPVEEVLAGIWAEVLRLERVGAHDNFFQLGGHSLVAVRTVSRIRDVFAVELPLRALFEGPTVAELAGRVEDERRKGLPALPPVVPVERTDALPLSFAQERLWFLDRLEPGSSAYNMSVAWRLGGALDAPSLERALGEIVRRHEALRTVFREVDGSPVQVVAPFGGFTLRVKDLSARDEAEREAAVKRRARREARRPFDLSAGPLFRAALLRLGEEDHVLILSMHHIVSDGWSMGVLFRELSALYAAYREGGESPLAELAVQYADYASWQRGQLEGASLEGQLSYWRDRLSGAPELLELPTDRPRPPVRTNGGAVVPVNLPLPLLERLQQLGQSEGTTLYMTLLGAFQVLLGKYAGSEDIVVGSPVAGRTRGEVEELIGFFVNTLVLRTDLSGDPGFREVLGRVREATLGAYEHQEVPFEKLVAELQPERSLGHSPLFQAMFILQNAGGEGAALPGLRVRGVGAELASAKFDLSLALAATSSGLQGGLTYSTDLFESATVERMAEHLERLLEQVAADPGVRLSRLELMGEQERALVLDAWSRTEEEHPADWRVHERFAAQAERTPNLVAVIFDGARLTYAELDARANQLAHHLRALGVGPEVRVGLCLERSPELVVSVLAVLKAGGAYVPLDPAYPAERLAYMLQDAAVPVLLTHSALEPRLAGHAARVVRVDVDADAIAREPAHAPGAGVAAQNLAYIIYTSGSTGRPKGAAIPHGGLARYLAWAGEAYGSTRRRGSPLHSSLSFDLTVTSLFLPLLAGQAVVLAPDTGVEALATVLRSSGSFGFIKLTPGHLSLLLAQLTECQAERATGRFVVGGESLPGEMLARWATVAPEVEVVNEYGPTETVVGCCIHTLKTREAGAGAVPIGRPSPGTALYVLDARTMPCPIGVPGELYIGGGQLGRGYLGRPALTADRFVPDPFSREPGARMYRTGDRVRWRSDGTLEFQGRMDHQVKIRGFRIEPGEIEAALRQHAGVEECIVIVREDRPGDKRLVAYVAGADGADAVDAAALRAHLRERLPEYMVPSALVMLEQLPLTPNAKVDRRALPAPNPGAAEETRVSPRTPVEEVLAGIWTEVLRVERVGVHDNFFQLGGHSLVAVRTVSRIRDVFAVELPLRALFEGPTVAELARAVEEMRRAELPALPAVVPVERTGALPLSFAQERLWFLDRLEPGSSAYNMSAAWRLAGALDQAALERALGEIVRRHEALRTTFADRDGAPVQVIAPFEGFALPVEELSPVEDADREAAVRRRAGEEARRAFDLYAGPLFRAALLRLDAEEHVLLLTMHHIVSDGWSMGVLFRELSALYAAYREGGESPLAELAVQYADYAVWQRGQLEGASLEGQLSYWRERLSGAPELLELPTDRPRPPVRSNRGAVVPVNLPLPLLERLQQLGQSEGTTLYMTLLGAFQVLLNKYGGGEDIVVGSPVAGRTRGEVEALIGFFVNTLVLRTDLSGDPGFREVLGRVREATLGAYEHQEVPFEKLVAELQPERSLGHSPLFQAMFTLQNAGGAGGTLPGLRVSGVESELASAKFDLSLSLAATPRGLQGGLTYSTDLFESATVERMAGHLERLLEQVAADPAVRLSRLELMDEAERALVLQAWNRTGEEHPVDGCVHERFQEQVERTPGAVAVIFEGARLTYAELDARANQLAHYLRALGVGPEVRVGLCLERSLELVVSVMAVLKAGGAYVPLDPAYPAERLAYMLANAGASVLVTEEGLHAALPAPPGVRVVRVDGERAQIAAQRTERPESGVGARSLAYVIYTSGSTGRPKGVAVEHGAAAAHLSGFARELRIGAADRVLHFASFGFDVAVEQLFVPLLAGAGLVLRGAEIWPPDEWPARVREAGITVANLPPAYWREVVAAGASALPGLRLMLVGAEAMPAETARRWRDRVDSPALLVNAYGPTESVITATTFPLPDDDPARYADAVVPIGRPLGGRAAFVLDASGRPVPLGVPGELYLGGAQVARGYLGRPALTAERFVPDPFGGEPGARLYRTGDRARWLAEGVLEYQGRLDEQVKVRGFRIEPGEIEAVLRRDCGVDACVVVAREDRPGDRRLVAYTVSADPEAMDAAAMREHLRRALPEYMVPAAFVVLDRLPLTANGKLDRKALPAPEYRAAERELAEPRSLVEVQLIQLWEELLGVSPIGATQSFFDLGGTSLLAVRLFSQANRRFGCDLPVSALFAGATVRQMADAILAKIEAGPAAREPVVALQPGGSLPPLFCVHATDRDVLGYVSLVRHLGADQPVYGVRDLGEDLSRPLAQLAAEHVEEIRAVQPEGPYHLAGWSFGGVVAFEMALQLERQGETVAFLGLIDSMSPALSQGAPVPDDLGVVLGVGRQIAMRAGRTLSLTARELEGLDRDERISRVVDHLQAQGPALPGLDDERFGEECRAMRDRIASGAAYVPGTLSGALTLFRAVDYAEALGRTLATEEERSTLGWSPLSSGPVALRWALGNHFTMITEPHVRGLAELVRESLESARLGVGPEALVSLEGV